MARQVILAFLKEDSLSVAFYDIFPLPFPDLNCISVCVHVEVESLLIFANVIGLTTITTTVAVSCLNMTLIGSGKTHTMTGERRGAARGIIPRAVEQIITQAMSMREAGWSQLHISASMVEVYNEELRDLLIPAAGKASSAKLSILYQRDNGRVHVNGLTSVELDSTSVDDGMRQLDEIMDIYASNRTTSRTEMNEQSSRSHALFMLDIVGRHSDGVTVMQGGVRLCDLAGSERLDRTGTASHAVGRKETASINQSLTTLGIVFRSLANKDKFVNYRDSKLTMLLQVRVYYLYWFYLPWFMLHTLR